jgi:hypothetical protein
MRLAMKKLNSFPEAMRLNWQPRYCLKATVSSALSPETMLDVFSECCNLKTLWFPKLASFYKQEDGSMGGEDKLI